jgi:hypothetical protein
MAAPHSLRRPAPALVVAAALAMFVSACSSGGDDESFCVFYRDFRAGVEAAEAAPGQEEVNPDLDEIVDEATDTAPGDIADAWSIIADSQNDFAEARARAGLDEENPDEEAFERFDMTDELAEAEDTVAAWVDDNCEPVNDL